MVMICFVCFLKVAAMFKIGNSKELPEIPNHLSEEGKDFVRQCLQRNPSNRPTAAKLLDHPFVKNSVSVDRPVLSADPKESIPALTHAVRALVSEFSLPTPPVLFIISFQLVVQYVIPFKSLF